MMAGFLYAIESGGRIKLGYSSQPARRLTKISSDTPFPCTLIGQWPGTKTDEAALHQKFEGCRIHREWFAASPDLMAYLDIVAMRDDKPGRFDEDPSDTPLASARKQKRMTQAACAKLVGCQRWMINRIEAKERRPSPQLAAKIEAVTGVDARVLLGIPQQEAS